MSKRNIIHFLKEKEEIFLEVGAGDRKGENEWLTIDMTEIGYNSCVDEFYISYSKLWNGFKGNRFLYKVQSRYCSCVGTDSSFMC